MSSAPPPPSPSDPAPAPARPRLNAVGEERPAFLLEYPADPALEALMLAFEAGDFATVRAQAPELARRTHSEEVRRAAEELCQRTHPDRLLVWLLALSISLFVFLVSWVYTR
jgi:hypothetical protein